MKENRVGDGARRQGGLMAGVLLALALPPDELPSQRVNARDLRELGVRVVSFDSEAGSLRASWTFEHEASLRTFDTTGAGHRRTSSGVTLLPATALTLRELAFESPVRIELELRRDDAESGLALLAVPVDGSGRIRSALVAWPVSADGVRLDGCGLAEPGADAGLRPGASSASATTVQPGAWTRVVVEFDGTEFSTTIGERPPWSVPWTVSAFHLILRTGAAGEVTLRELAVDGRVSVASVRKLVGATRASASRADGPSLWDDRFGLAASVAMFLASDGLTDRFRPLPEMSWEAKERRRREREAAKRRAELARKGIELPDFDISKLEPFGEPWPTSIMSRDQEAHAAIIEAHRLLKSKDALPRDIEAAIDRAESADARAAVVPLLRAIHAEDARDFAAAERAYEVVTTRRGGTRLAAARIGIGRMRFMRGDLTGALEAFERVSNSRRSDPRGNHWLALTLLLDGEPHEVLRVLRRIPDSKSGGFADALRTIAERLEESPDWTSYSRGKGTAIAVETSVPEGYVKTVSADVRDFLDFLESEFPLGNHRDRRTRVWVFDSQREYLRYVERFAVSAEHTAGVYSRANRTLMLFAGIDEVRNRTVLFHEAWHAYLHRAVSRAPIWFDEGHAEFFSSVELPDEGSPTVGGLRDERIGTLRGALANDAGLIALEDLLTMDQGRFMDPERAALCYAQSWAVVHWLRASGDADAAGLYEAYVHAVLGRRTAEEAWSDTFGALPGSMLRTMRERFRRYVLEELLGGR